MKKAFKVKKEVVYNSIEIKDIAAEGKAIARIDDLVVFVDNAVPGDLVDIKITRRKKNYREGTAIHFHKKSDKRENPLCEHFGTCGGCKWQDLKYEHQLFYKQKQVYDALTRIAKVPIPEIIPIIGSEPIYKYRNKLEYTFSCFRWFTKEEMSLPAEERNPNGLGFHIPGMFDKVLDITTCYLQDEPTNKIRLAAKKFALENGLPFSNIRTHAGLLRNLIIRNTLDGDLMVIAVFYDGLVDLRENFLKFLATEFPEITSLMYIINNKVNDSYADLDVYLYHGKDYMIETMEDLQFKIGPKSFYQTNSRQAYQLYFKTREFAQLTGNEVVYDLYTGTGTIANFVARKAKKVVGIEYIPEAIEDAKANSVLNKIENTFFVAGDMKDVLTDSFISENGIPNVIILDPPRAGVHADVITVIKNANPKRIVYVSCNPATQARDIQLLSDMYEVKKIQPVDMFPHTYHVENIVLMERI